MDHDIVHELAPTLRVCVTRPMPDLPHALEQVVEELWQRACARMARGRAGGLFNGRVFSADSISGTLITGHITEYRRTVAQFEDPALFEQLGLRPLAVCGVLRCADGVVIGRRHVDAIYQAGMWQLPPAGSVDASSIGDDGNVDLEQQILTELQEELGLTADTVDAVQPLCALEHAATHVTDIGLALGTSLDTAAVLAAHRVSGNTEYDPLIAVGYATLPAKVAELGETLVPSAPAFLRSAGLLGGC